MFYYIHLINLKLNICYFYQTLNIYCERPCVSFAIPSHDFFHLSGNKRIRLWKDTSSFEFINESTPFLKYHDVKCCLGIWENNVEYD